MCSEVVTSDIFSALNENDENKLDENEQINMTDDQLNLSFKCSTPIPNSEESM